MNAANWLTLLASAVALLSVFVTYRLGLRQINNAADIARAQIRATTDESSRRLKADLLLTNKQTWLREFRETVNDLVYYADPDLDASSQPSRAERIQRITHLGIKIDLLLPVGQSHANIAHSAARLATLLQDPEATDADRLNAGSKIIILARQIIQEESAAIESAI